MKLHCNLTFARRAKLVTSSARTGESAGSRGASWHSKYKGALRMNVGMPVRGGLLAALVMFAVPVAASLAGMLAASPAIAQTASSIQVEGNRRVEADTIRSYFKRGPGGQL